MPEESIPRQYWSETGNFLKVHPHVLVLLELLYKFAFPLCLHLDVMVPLEVLLLGYVFCVVLLRRVPVCLATFRIVLKAAGAS